VKRFQARHGLDPYGRIGAATLRQLNTPLSRRVRQLQLTLERYRWAPHRFSHPPVIVNTPEFRLRAMNDSFATEIEMKVVVGRAFRTIAPVFAREMKFVVFRPYWEVPATFSAAKWSRR
jgi:murein L,D-transpeptidase YcbB/YkuD